MGSRMLAPTSNNNLTSTSGFNAANQNTMVRIFFLVLEKNYWIRIIVSCAKKEIKVYSKNFKKLRNCKILLPALYLIMWLMKSQFDFEKIVILKI